MTTLMILALVVALLTPPLTELVKKYATKNKIVLALSPGIYGVITWLLDTLVLGISPFSDQGMAILYALVGAGAIGGQLLRGPIHQARKALADK